MLMMCDNVKLTIWYLQCRNNIITTMQMLVFGKVWFLTVGCSILALLETEVKNGGEKNYYSRGKKKESDYNFLLSCLDK